MKSISEMEGVQQKPLKYSIHACSSHSGASRIFLLTDLYIYFVSASYIPENIMEDRPSDQTSRYYRNPSLTRPDLLSQGGPRILTAPRNIWC